MKVTDNCSRSNNSVPTWLVAELRSDHAGETGAVWIYKGILAVSNEIMVREFSEHHLATEKEHLELIESLLDRKDRSLLIPFWKFSGFLTGALPALMGPRVVFATVSAVEKFVVSHYQSQINRLKDEKLEPNICCILQSCCDDEARHELEAASLLHSESGIFLRIWCWLVNAGSNLAVKLARIL